MKRVGFAVGTVLLVFVIAFSVTSTVKSQSKEELAANEAYFQVLEKEYVTAMRDYLNEAGFRNSGVMLTRTVFEDGSREYQIAIHHSRIIGLSGAEQKALKEELLEKAFTEENCSFVCCLTENT